jgi:hypothetical protein
MTVVEALAPAPLYQCLRCQPSCQLPQYIPGDDMVVIRTERGYDGVDEIRVRNIVPECGGAEGWLEATNASDWNAETHGNTGADYSRTTTHTQRWCKFFTPNGYRAWWWCEANDTHFFEDQAFSWKQYRDTGSNRLWWYNSTTGDAFFEP